MREQRPGLVMRWILLLASLPLGMAVALQAVAGSADIEGAVSYQISGDRVTVEIDRIANNTSNLTTGTLYLTVRMTEGSSVFDPGHNVGRHQFTGSSNGQLGPGQFFSDVRLTLDYTQPPPGTYYVHFWTSQFPDDNTLLDSITFSDRLIVGEGGGSGGSADIEGSTSYHISGNRITAEIDRIANNTSNSTTGTLYLTIRMTQGSSVDGSGHNVARHQFTGSSNGQLGPGQSFSNLRLTLDYTQPPPGAYYVHFITSQYPDPDTILDSRTFSNTLVVEGSTDPPSNVRLDDIDIVCPCRIDSTGEQATVTLGVRSFREDDSGELRLRLIALIPEGAGRYYDVGTVALEISISGNSTLQAAQVPFRWGSRPEGNYQLAIRLEELGSSGWSRFDHVPMEATVNLSRPFQVNDLDLLADSDGDGVGDVNERSEGTDPNDPESKPGPSTIDVLALYSPGFADLYDGDPDTRIHHVMTVADGIYQDSGTGVRLRLAGIEQTDVEDDNDDAGIVLDELSKSSAVEQLRDRYGADLLMMFTPKPPLTQVCGRAHKGGFHGSLGTRGDMSLSADLAYSVVYGDCEGTTAAHEIGHNLGLGHSFKQQDNGPQGTFRWSRGHYVGAGTATSVDVQGDPGTVMTYGQRFGDVFSDPGRDCGGSPCGKDRNAQDGADAVASINAVRFQVAGFRESTHDLDGDGIPDDSDPDDDNDGVMDEDDPFPLDPAEWVDTDGDGVGDNADRDDDNDGVADGNDVYPLDSNEWADSDGDGVGDNWDLLPLDPSRVDLTASYSFVGEARGDGAGGMLSAGDFDGDGRRDIVVAAPHHGALGMTSVGAVYVIAAADLLAVDAADGSVDQTIHLGHVASGRNSWKLVGEDDWDQSGLSLATADLDGDGKSDLIVGAASDWTTWSGDEGAVYLLASADLAAADAADDKVDGVIGMANTAALPGSWKLVGARHNDGAGASVAAVEDIDGDDRPEVAVGAPGYDRNDLETPGWDAGAVYVVASGDLPSLDADDGMADGVIDLVNASTLPNSWMLLGEARREEAGSSLTTVDDIDGDGLVELLLGAPYHDAAEDRLHGGAAYLMSGGRLAAADAADGEVDGVIDLRQVVELPDNWKFIGERWSNVGETVSSSADLNGDDLVELIIGGDGSYGAYVVSSAGLGSMDSADGSADGTIDLQQAPLPPDSWRVQGLSVAAAGDVDGDGLGDLMLGETYPASSFLLHGSDLDRLPGVIDSLALDEGAAVWKFTGAGGDALYPAGDLDGDGRADLLIGNAGSWDGPGVAYILLGADLAVLDEADGTADRSVGLHNVAGDTDADGVRNIVDQDDDGDGVTDRNDFFPLINDDGGSTERDDDDGDGVPDVDDAFPRDPTEWADSDGDGIGDNADPDDAEPDTGSGWVSGVFLPASTFAAQCVNPRTGNDPRDDLPWPDIQGRTVDENNWLRSWSNETYLWYDEIEDRDPGLYDDPLQYFDLLRSTELTPSGAPKDQLHYTYDTAEWYARSQAGESAGYGATWTIIARAPPREALVAYTDPDTPASDAGVRRGAQLVSIDGIDFVNAGDRASVELINQALFPDSAGETHVFEFRDAGSETTQTVSLTSEIIASTPVQHVGTVTSPAGATVGYMLFNDHLRTAETGLIDAFRTFNNVPGGIEDLIIDMRYNGGGYLYIASQLGYMIAGEAATAGQVFERLIFNDKHPETNPVTGDPLRPIPFYSETEAAPSGLPLPTLDLRRVILLTGPNTCSAGESLINALRGIDIEVILIGEPTCGKPFGFYPTDNCGTTYFTVQFRGVNAKGFGDYGDGFMPIEGATGEGSNVPGCRVPDDFSHPLGDPAEGRLATALSYRDSSACPVSVSAARPAGAGTAAAHILESRDGTVHKPPWLTNRILEE